MGDRRKPSSCNKSLIRLSDKRWSPGSRPALLLINSKRNPANYSVKRSLTLTRSHRRDPIASAELKRLAAALVGRSPSPYRLDQARIAAEAEVEVRRVRAHRKALLDRKAVELAAIDRTT